MKKINWEKEREIRKRYKLDNDYSYNTIKKIIKIMDELKEKASVKDTKSYNDYLEFYGFMLHAMQAYINAEKSMIRYRLY